MFYCVDVIHYFLVTRSSPLLGNPLYVTAIDARIRFYLFTTINASINTQLKSEFVSFAHNHK